MTGVEILKGLFGLGFALLVVTMIQVYLEKRIEKRIESK